MAPPRKQTLVPALPRPPQLSDLAGASLASGDTTPAASGILKSFNLGNAGNVATPTPATDNQQAIWRQFQFTESIDPHNVLVIKLGSYEFQYGMANEKVPQKLQMLVGFEKHVKIEAVVETKSSPKASVLKKMSSNSSMEDGANPASPMSTEPAVFSSSGRAIRKPKAHENLVSSPTAPNGGVISANKQVAQKNDQLESHLNSIAEKEKLLERRRGGGKPVPWSAEMEILEGNEAENKEENDAGRDGDGDGDDGADSGERSPEKLESSAIIDKKRKRALFHNDIELDSYGESYDLVRPIWNGLISWTSYPKYMIEAAIDTLFEYAVQYAVESVEREEKNAAGMGQGDPAAKKAKLDRRPKVGVMLVVPEEASRVDTSFFVARMFNSKQVSCVALHHSSVAASFGAGLATCVVVDVGHCCGYVACVDDGSVLIESRLCLSYGGGNIGNVLSELFKLKLKTPPSFSDTDLLLATRTIKESMCTLDANENDTLLVKTFATKSHPRVRAKIGVGVALVPPLSMFMPTVFRSVPPIDTRLVFGHTRSLGRFSSPEDSDSSYFETMIDENIFRGSRPMAITGYFPEKPWTAIVSDTLNAISVPPGEAHAPEESLEKAYPLGEAVLKSILLASMARAPNNPTEFRKRFFGAILLVGGSAGFNGLDRHLEEDLKNKLESSNDPTLRGGNIAVEVLVGGKEMATSELAWKGGAVIASSEVIGELWVTQDDWARKGSLAIKEKCPFCW